MFTQQTAEAIVGAVDDPEHTVLARSSRRSNPNQGIELCNIIACTHVRHESVEIAESAIIARLGRVPDGARGA